MNLCRCEKGHFYDKEKYATCPHCSGGAASDDTLTTAFTEDVTAPAGGALGNGMQIPTDFGVAEPPKTPGGLPIADIPANQMTVGYGVQPGDTPTVPLENNLGFPSTGTQMIEEEDDHTRGWYDDIFKTEDAGLTVVPSNIKSNKVSTPCVGWLIALSGEHLGADFRLKVGKNFIGRNANMDVALTEDMRVSREKQAIVVYEPKTHMYLVQPGEASSLVYRNNEVVLTPVKLEAYDVITVGDINLLFIPLCGERFNWGDLFEEMKKNK